eukprot:15433695-Alexandrium_andersonii.AAC.1
MPGLCGIAGGAPLPRAGAPPEVAPVLVAGVLLRLGRERRRSAARGRAGACPSCWGIWSKIRAGGRPETRRAEGEGEDEAAGIAFLE